MACSVAVYALISINRLRAEVLSCIQLCGLEAPPFLHCAPAGWDEPLLPCWQRGSRICFGLSWLGWRVSSPTPAPRSVQAQPFMSALLPGSFPAAELLRPRQCGVKCAFWEVGVGGSRKLFNQQSCLQGEGLTRIIGSIRKCLPLLSFPFFVCLCKVKDCHGFSLCFNSEN